MPFGGGPPAADALAVLFAPLWCEARALLFEPDERPFLPLPCLPLPFELAEAAVLSDAMGFCTKPGGERLGLGRFCVFSVCTVEDAEALDSDEEEVDEVWACECVCVWDGSWWCGCVCECECEEEGCEDAEEGVAREDEWDAVSAWEFGSRFVFPLTRSRNVGVILLLAKKPPPPPPPVAVFSKPGGLLRGEGAGKWCCCWCLRAVPLLPVPPLCLLEEEPRRCPPPAAWWAW